MFPQIYVRHSPVVRGFPPQKRLSLQNPMRWQYTWSESTLCVLSFVRIKAIQQRHADRDGITSSMALPLQAWLSRSLRGPALQQCS